MSPFSVWINPLTSWLLLTLACFHILSKGRQMATEATGIRLPFHNKRLDEEESSYLTILCFTHQTQAIHFHGHVS